MNEKFSVKAKLDKNGTMWLPMPDELDGPTRITFAASLVLASRGKARIGIAQDGEIKYKKN